MAKSNSIEKKTAIMLVGLPGSGKSTWAKEYASNNPDVEIISSDDIVEELGGELGFPSYQEAFDNVDFQEVERRMYARLEKAIYDGKHIVWDQTNLSKKSRKFKLAKIPKSKYNRYVKKFILDDAELSNRLNQRAKEMNKIIPHQVIAQMKKSANYNTADEDFDADLT